MDCFASLAMTTILPSVLLKKFRGNSMSANNAFHIAVLSGDGIGPEVMAPALEVLRKIEATSDLKFRFTDAPAGANNYAATGKSMPESTVRLCDEADAILLGACGLPSVRYPDNTEIMPQVELRFRFDLYAGVRPARLIPGVPSPIVGADRRGIDLIVIRESTEGLFASMGKGVVTDTEARETLVITRKTSERLFEFSFRLAERRKARGRPGALTCVDKANVFKAFAFFREMFAAAASNISRKNANALNTFALSTQVSAPGRPRALRRSASRNENSNNRSEVFRVMTSVSRASVSVTTPFPIDANRPSVDSRITIRSMPRRSAPTIGLGTPGISRAGRTKA